jgi:tRNA-splicing endonuclease subunit Sen2
MSGFSETMALAEIIEGQVLVRRDDDVWLLHRWEAGAHGELVTADASLTPVSHRVASAPGAEPCYLILSLVETFDLAFVQHRLQVTARSGYGTSTGARKRQASDPDGRAADGLVPEGPFEEAGCWSAFCGLSARFPYEYAAYRQLLAEHWLVRSGVQFGADFVLYRRGPRSDHASHLVLVQAGVEAARSWITVQGHVRLSQQVGKRLILCHVASAPDTDAPLAGADAQPAGGLVEPPTCVSAPAHGSLAAGKDLDSSHLVRVPGPGAGLSWMRVTMVQVNMWSPARAHGEESQPAAEEEHMM